METNNNNTNNNNSETATQSSHEVTAKQLKPSVFARLW